MFGNFWFSFNAVMPIFLCCVVGYLLRQLHMVSEAFVADSTKVVFYVTIPCGILRSMLSCDLKETFNPNLILYTVGAILLTAVVLVLAVPRIIHDRRKAATVAVDMFRGNFAILGIPLATSLMGVEGTAPTMTLIPFGMILYNVLTVLILVMFSGEEHPEGGVGKAVKDALVKAAKNPLTIASFLSLLIGVLALDLPTVLDNTIDKLADMTTGLALIMLGAQFDFKGCWERMRYSVPTILVRLLAIPLVVVGGAAALGFRNAELVAVYVFFAAPSAVNCFILARRLGGDGEIAADAVLTTSCAAVATLTLGVFLLRTLGWI